MKPQPANSVPKMLPGAVVRQFIRCGNAQCKCARGELHGPYFYRKWRDGSRQHKQYIRPDELEAVMAACAAERQLLRAGRIARALDRQDWRRLVALIREVEGRWQTP